MTVSEFSDQFDVLVASYRRFTDFDSKEAPDTIEFNEYEKSVYLTKAQEEYVKELYNGVSTGKAFETNEERRRQLELILKQKTYEENDAVATPVLRDGVYVHTTFQLPTDCWYIVYEQVIRTSTDTCINGKAIDVVPATHDEFWRIHNNPFRGPNTKRVLRLDNGNNQVELVSLFDIDTYIIRYLEKPEPIILADLPNGVTFDGNKTTALTCKLSTLLHLNILEAAVRLALANRLINTKSDNKGDS